MNLQKIKKIVIKKRNLILQKDHDVGRQFREEAKRRTLSWDPCLVGGVGWGGVGWGEEHETY